MVLNRPLTTRECKVYVAGRKISEGKSLSFEVNMGVQSLSLLNTDKKKYYKTKEGVTGSVELVNTDMYALGQVLRETQIDPSETETVSMTEALNNAEQTIEYIQGYTDGNQSVLSTEKIAWSFYAPLSKLIHVKVYNPTAITSTVTIELQTDSSGSPSGTVLASGTLDFTTTGWKQWTANYTNLTKGEKYWIVLYSTVDFYVAKSSVDFYKEWDWKKHNGTAWSSTTEGDIKMAMKFQGKETYIEVYMTDGTNEYTILLDEVSFESVSLNFGQDEAHGGELSFTAKSITIT